MEVNRIGNTVSLFNNQAGNGVGVSHTVEFGGTYTYDVAGTFDGATVQLEMLLSDGSTYAVVASTGLTAAGVVTVQLSVGATVRGNITGGTAPTGIYSSLKLVQ